MSVTFEGELDVSNGLASRLLRAIGYPVGEDSDGSMPIKEALEGIQRAKGTMGEDEKYLGYLEELVTSLQADGADLLSWS